MKGAWGEHVLSRGVGVTPRNPTAADVPAGQQPHGQPHATPRARYVFPTPLPKGVGKRGVDASSLRGDPADLIVAADLDPGDLLRARLARTNPPWMTDAACAKPNAPNMFATTKAGISAALAMCGTCRVLPRCRDWAVTAAPPLEGCVVGGMTPRALKLARPRRKTGPKARGT